MARSKMAAASGIPLVVVEHVRAPAQRLLAVDAGLDAFAEHREQLGELLAREHQHDVAHGAGRRRAERATNVGEPEGVGRRRAVRTSNAARARSSRRSIGWLAPSAVATCAARRLAGSDQIGDAEADRRHERDGALVSHRHADRRGTGRHRHITLIRHVEPLIRASSSWPLTTR